MITLGAHSVKNNALLLYILLIFGNLLLLPFQLRGYKTELIAKRL